MKILENGKYREATLEEIAIFSRSEPTPYEERVVNRIRERYSINDEIAILRQRDSKPQEYFAYNSFVEKIKQEEKAK